MHQSFYEMVGTHHYTIQDDLLVGVLFGDFSKKLQLVDNIFGILAATCHWRMCRINKWWIYYYWLFSQNHQLTQFNLSSVIVTRVFKIRITNLL